MPHTLTNAQLEIQEEIMVRFLRNRERGEGAENGVGPSVRKGKLPNLVTQDTNVCDASEAEFDELCVEEVRD